MLTERACSVYTKHRASQPRSTDEEVVVMRGRGPTTSNRTFIHPPSHATLEPFVLPLSVLSRLVHCNVFYACICILTCLLEFEVQKSEDAA